MTMPSTSCISTVGRMFPRFPLSSARNCLSRCSQTSPGFQFNGHETGDGELILEHAGKLGFEGVVSKTIDAPYAPGNRGLWRKANWLNRQEFVIVGWSDPEKERGRISGRCSRVTIPMTASSYTPVGWAQGCPTRCSPICGAASTH